MLQVGRSWCGTTGRERCIMGVKGHGESITNATRDTTRYARKNAFNGRTYGDGSRSPTIHGPVLRAVLEFWSSRMRQLNRTASQRRAKVIRRAKYRVLFCMRHQYNMSYLRAKFDTVKFVKQNLFVTRGNITFDSFSSFD
jgi:hypothetical protein